MSIKEALLKYLNKEISALELIQLITGAFNPDQAVDLLALVNQISRHANGDLDTATFKSLWGLE